MTIEQAKSELMQIYGALSPSKQQAIDTLVKIEPCEDAISRQAVLDGIDELKKSPWATDKRGFGFEYLITEALDVVADLCVKQAPSVNPQPCEDAISRDELLKAIDTWDKFGCDADTKLVRYQDHYVPYIHYDDVIKCIKGMPPVNPQEPKYCDRNICIKNEYSGIGCDNTWKQARQEWESEVQNESID